MIVLDTCHSGSLLDLLKYDRPDNIVAVGCSSQRDEESLEDVHGGTFTRSLMSNLSGANLASFLKGNKFTPNLTAVSVAAS